MREPRPAAVFAALVATAVLATLQLLVPSPVQARWCSGPASWSSFSPDQRLVLTYYYYWYTPGLVDRGGLVLNPPDGVLPDRRSMDWHARQLADMAEAGVDVALPVYWGTVYPWSSKGLDALVNAREARLAAGQRVPPLGLFLDTNNFGRLVAQRPGQSVADLGSPAGKAALYDQVRRFFREVPACHWAKIGGRPLVVVWQAQPDGVSLTYDETVFAALYDWFEQDFGVRPFIVREASWDVVGFETPRPVQTDEVYMWGAALGGPFAIGGTVSVGPGYDDRLLPDREGLFRDRQGGANYARGLQWAIQSGKRWLFLETWNELFEGTAIAETAEYDRLYIELTRTYADRFKALDVPPPAKAPAPCSKKVRVSC